MKRAAAFRFRDKLRFSVNMQSSYTTNALLTGNNDHSDVLFLPTLEAGFHTPLDKHFNFDLDSKVESAIYSRYQDRGFVGYDVLGTLDYHIKPGLPRFYTTIEGRIVTTASTPASCRPRPSASPGARIGASPSTADARSAFWATASSDYRFRSASIDTRPRCTGPWPGLPTSFRSSNLTAQFYYVYQYSDYTEFDRSDSKHTVSGALIYQFNDHWYGSLTTSYIDQGSTQQHASYQTFSTALGLSLHF